MSEDYEYRYLFLVRQSFGKTPHVDAFYQLQVPPGITGEQAKIMTTLNPDFCQKEISEDGHAIKGMTLRLRFNSDMYQRVCMVKTTCPITPNELDAVIASKFKDGTLQAFLDEAGIVS